MSAKNSKSDSAAVTGLQTRLIFKRPKARNQHFSFGLKFLICKFPLYIAIYNNNENTCKPTLTSSHNEESQINVPTVIIVATTIKAGGKKQRVENICCSIIASLTREYLTAKLISFHLSFGSLGISLVFFHISHLWYDNQYLLYLYLHFFDIPNTVPVSAIMVGVSIHQEYLPSLL